MVQGSADVFVVTLEAREDGRPASVLAFAQAESESAAEVVATAELTHFGWTEIQVLRIAQVIDEAALPEDFRDAMANARTYGCGLIIYDGA